MPSVTEARHEFAELVNRAAFGKERIELQRHGRSIAALVSVEDLELLERLEDAVDVRAIAEALADAENRGASIPWDAVR
jgi:prevent-host-death family protein